MTVRRKDSQQDPPRPRGRLSMPLVRCEGIDQFMPDFVFYRENEIRACNEKIDKFPVAGLGLTTHVVHPLQVQLPRNAGEATHEHSEKQWTEPMTRVRV